MNDAEKESIKTLADLKERKFYTHAFDNGTLVLDDDEIESIDRVLNLIEKQEKVIDEMAKASHLYFWTNDEKIMITHNPIFIER